MLTHERPIEEIIVDAARRGAAVAMADLASFYGEVGELLREGRHADLQPDCAVVGRQISRIDGCRLQCERLGVDFDAVIEGDTLDAIVDGEELSEEGKEFLAGFVRIAVNSYRKVRASAGEEERLATRLAEARIAVRIAAGDPLADNGASDHAEARDWVSSIFDAQDRETLGLMREHNRLLLNAVARS